MPQKRIADRRTYGIDPRTGHEVLIALAGHPLPDWYVEPQAHPTLEPGKAPDPPGAGGPPATVERIPKRSTSKSSTRKPRKAPGK